MKAAYSALVFAFLIAGCYGRSLQQTVRVVSPDGRQQGAASVELGEASASAEARGSNSASAASAARISSDGGAAGAIAAGEDASGNGSSVGAVVSSTSAPRKRSGSGRVPRRERAAREGPVDVASARELEDSATVSVGSTVRTNDKQGADEEAVTTSTSDGKTPGMVEEVTTTTTTEEEEEEEMMLESGNQEGSETPVQRVCLSPGSLDIRKYLADGYEVTTVKQLKSGLFRVTKTMAHPGYTHKSTSYLSSLSKDVRQLCKKQLPKNMRTDSENTMHLICQSGLTKSFPELIKLCKKYDFIKNYLG